MPMRRGFTVLELMALVAAGALLVPLAAGIFGRQPDSAREVAQRKKDETQVRGIHQAFVVWAQNNKDAYPLPSKIDTENFTVTDRGSLKNTTSNIYSMLVFNGSISTEILISPVEADANIVLKNDYEFDQPKKAAKPAQAVWDPAFGVDFTEGRKGNASYAHLQPAGGRVKRWSNTFKAQEKIVGMRGPEISKIAKNDDRSVTPTLANPKSATLGMYEISPTTWSGNIACNDNHVAFLKRALSNEKKIVPDPKEASYKDADGKTWPDLWNYDEQDDTDSVNDFLGIFTRAGSKPVEFKGIWD